MLTAMRRWRSSSVGVEASSAASVGSLSSRSVFAAFTSSGCRSRVRFAAEDRPAWGVRTSVGGTDQREPGMARAGEGRRDARVAGAVGAVGAYAASTAAASSIGACAASASPAASMRRRAARSRGRELQHDASQWASAHENEVEETRST